MEPNVVAYSSIAGLKFALGKFFWVGGLGMEFVVGGWGFGVWVSVGV